jgi:hypothetical protein
MAKNRLEDLRNHLFETLEALKDDERPMDVERAHAVAEVAHAIINSAKLELRFMELSNHPGESEFLSPPPRTALAAVKDNVRSAGVQNKRPSEP